jgi:hypothetical protein
MLKKIKYILKKRTETKISENFEFNKTMIDSYRRMEKV